jgi:hypothetical protein
MERKPSKSQGLPFPQSKAASDSNSLARVQINTRSVRYKREGTRSFWVTFACLLFNPNRKYRTGVSVSPFSLLYLLPDIALGPSVTFSGETTTGW